MDRNAWIRLLGTWAVVYPMVTGSLYLFRWLGLTLPMPVQTLILTGLLVPLIGLVLAPALGKRFPSKPKPQP